MPNSQRLSEKYKILRRQAEERIKQWPNIAFYSHTDLQQIIHELRKHLAEQEILNEELRKLTNLSHDEDNPRYESGPAHDPVAQTENYHFNRLK